MIKKDSDYNFGDIVWYFYKPLIPYEFEIVYKLIISEEKNIHEYILRDLCSNIINLIVVKIDDESKKQQFFENKKSAYEEAIKRIDYKIESLESLKLLIH